MTPSVGTQFQGEPRQRGRYIYREWGKCENRQFFSPRIFNAPAEWVLLGIRYRRWGQQTKMMGQRGRTRSLTIIFNRVDTIHQRKIR